MQYDDRNKAKHPTINDTATNQNLLHHIKQLYNKKHFLHFNAHNTFSHTIESTQKQDIRKCLQGTPMTQSPQVYSSNTKKLTK
eukprot:15349598-Ditylum_brightwellii.AAC.1